MGVRPAGPAVRPPGAVRPRPFDPRGESDMPVVKVTRAGVRSAPREVPTETTATVMPMTLDRVG